MPRIDPPLSVESRQSTIDVESAQVLLSRPRAVFAKARPRTRLDGPSRKRHELSMSLEDRVRLREFGKSSARIERRSLRARIRFVAFGDMK